jgi:SUMO ligase MMS21 Smc5/6 complex component
MDTLKKYSNELFVKAGAIKGIKKINPENQLRGSLILEGEKIDIELYITLSPENPPLIQEYHIREVPKENLKTP